MVSRRAPVGTSDRPGLSSCGTFGEGLKLLRIIGIRRYVGKPPGAETTNDVELLYILGVGQRSVIGLSGEALAAKG